MELSELQKEYLKNSSLDSMEDWKGYAEYLEQVVAERDERLIMQRNEIVRKQNEIKRLNDGDK